MKRNLALSPSEVSSLAGRQAAGAAEIARPSLLDDERGNRVVLPADHPVWRRDNLSLSARAKALLAKVRPYVIHVLTFWDHRATTLSLDDVRIDIDASGSYRVT